jgi:hypothetical protein
MLWRNILEPKNQNDEGIEIVERDSMGIVLSDEDKLMELVNVTLNNTIPNILSRIALDHERSTDFYEELRELFLRGETDPEFLSQLNAANSNIQTTTDNLIKVLDKLSRLKSGEARIQIANIQAETKDATGTNKNLRAQLLDVIADLE